MAESTSPKKPAGGEPSADRASDQIIRLDSEREQRRANTVVDDEELDSPLALEPAALEAPSAQPRQAAVTVAPPAPAKPRRSLTRPVLFALLPVALVAGGYFYVTGGQVMSTDNAYVQADIGRRFDRRRRNGRRDRRPRQRGGEKGRRCSFA